jgi:protease IV
MSKWGKIILVSVLTMMVVVMIGGGLLVYGLYNSVTSSLNSGSEKVEVTGASILELTLKGQVVDASQPDELMQLFTGRRSTFSSLIQAVKRAKSDDNVKGILMLIDGPEMGRAHIEELRSVLEDFKTSKKPVLAYMEQGADREYALAIAADKIYLSPVGNLGIRGMAAQVDFYGGLFEKLKVEPNAVRYGKYKSAVERYTRTSMSEEDREELTEVLQGIYDNQVDAIAKARKKSPDEVRNLIDNGPYSTAEKAKAAGLVDEALYFDQVKDKIKTDLKLTEYKAVNAGKYGTRNTNLNGEKIAVIYANGQINSGKSNNGAFGEESIGSDTVAAAIRKAREDKDIKAIILRIDSPGGSALASDIIWREVMLTKQAKKPLVASMSDVAASGGYYIAMAADKIVADPSTITGSIGVFTLKLNLAGLYREHLGINIETIKLSKNADIYSPYSSFTEEQKQKLQEDMDQFYKTFIGKVAEGRKMSVEAVDKIAQGRIWTGLKGKELGLVDEIGGMEKAVEVAKKLANIPDNKDVNLVDYPKSKPFLQALINVDGDEASWSKIYQHFRKEQTAAELPVEVRRSMSRLMLIKQLESEPVLTLMPYTLTVE